MKEYEEKDILRYYDEYLDMLLDLDDPLKIRDEILTFRSTLRAENPAWAEDLNIFYSIEAKALLKYIELCKKSI